MTKIHASTRPVEVTSITLTHVAFSDGTVIQTARATLSGGGFAVPSEQCVTITPEGDVCAHEDVRAAARCSVTLVRHAAGDMEGLQACAIAALLKLVAPRLDARAWLASLDAYPDDFVEGGAPCMSAREKGSSVRGEA